MALNFAGGGTDRLTIASAASIDSLDPGTWWMWCRPTTFNNSDGITGKGASIFRIILSGGSGNIRYNRVRSSGNLAYITNSTPLIINVWNFLAIVLDTSAGAGEVANIYRGSLTEEAVESTYGTANDGAGTVSDDSGNDQEFGNNGGANNAFEGDIGCCGIISSALTLGQLRTLQFMVRPDVNAVAYYQLGFNGIGTQPDLSGNGNNGAVTGATVVDHVPLGPPFGFDLGWQGQFLAAGAPSGIEVFRRRIEQD